VATLRLWHLPFETFRAHFLAAHRPGVSRHSLGPMLDDGEKQIAWSDGQLSAHLGRHINRFASHFMQTLSAKVLGDKPSSIS